MQATTSFDAAFGSIAADFQAAPGPKERAGLLLKYADRLPHLPADQRTDANRVMGCTAQVGLGPRLCRQLYREAVPGRTRKTVACAILTFHWHVFAIRWLP